MIVASARGPSANSVACRAPHLGHRRLRLHRRRGSRARWSAQGGRVDVTRRDRAAARRAAPAQLGARGVRVDLARAGDARGRSPTARSSSASRRPAPIRRPRSAALVAAARTRAARLRVVDRRLRARRRRVGRRELADRADHDRRARARVAAEAALAARDPRDRAARRRHPRPGPRARRSHPRGHLPHRRRRQRARQPHPRRRSRRGDHRARARATVTGADQHRRRRSGSDRRGRRRDRRAARRAAAAARAGRHASTPEVAGMLTADRRIANARMKRRARRRAALSELARRCSERRRATATSAQRRAATSAARARRPLAGIAAAAAVGFFGGGDRRRGDRRRTPHAGPVAPNCRLSVGHSRQSHSVRRTCRCPAGALRAGRRARRTATPSPTSRRRSSVATALKSGSQFAPQPTSVPSARWREAGELRRAGERRERRRRRWSTDTSGRPSPSVADCVATITSRRRRITTSWIGSRRREHLGRTSSPPSVERYSAIARRRVRAERGHEHDVGVRRIDRRDEHDRRRAVLHRRSSGDGVLGPRARRRRRCDSRCAVGVPGDLIAGDVDALRIRSARP